MSSAKESWSPSKTIEINPNGPLTIKGANITMETTDTSMSINVPGDELWLEAGTELHLHGGSICTKDKNTNNKEVDLANYPIKWTAIDGKPNLNMNSYANIGWYSETTMTSDETNYSSLAACFIERNLSTGEMSKQYFYLSKGGTWIKFTPGTNPTFTPIRALYDRNNI